MCPMVNGIYESPKKNCLKYIRYDSPHSMCDFGMDFCQKTYTEIHGLDVERGEVNFDVNEIQNGSIVYVKWDYIDDFSKQLPELDYKMNTTNSKFILLTGRGDAHISQPMVNYLLNFKSIAKWFRCNPVSFDPRIDFFPIGFGEVERQYGCPELIDSLYNEDSIEKINKIYVPIFANTNSKRSIWMKEFIEKYKDICVVEKPDIIPDDPHSGLSGRLPPKKYMETLSKYKYCLCLNGDGQDVHRNYECLLTSTVPVMPDTPIRQYYNQLGISNEPMENFTGTVEFNVEDKQKVLYNYWYDKLKKAQKEIRGY